MADAARVFISYSSKDGDIVERVKAALASAGVVVWLDHEQLTPGTPNWEVSVREGIAQATTVVYVASPDAALSPYVIHEIEMARGKGKPVLPFWIRGENWYDCAPMGWYRAQYTDGRAGAYASGVATLLAALGVSARSVAPTLQPQPIYPPPTVPASLARLGFRGVNPKGTPGILPPLVTVAAGPFQMGSEKAQDSQAQDNETPRHRVELAAFQIGTYSVTVAEYALAVQAGAVREPPTWRPSEMLVKFGWPDRETTWQMQLQRLDHPVVCVSWGDAQTYLTWLRNATREPGWRLPSEAEWEKAARWDQQRSVSRIYPWGDSFDQNRCNTSESGLKTTTPVGSYPASDAPRSGASPWGAEGMAGNVWEWTSSVFNPYPYTPSDGREASDSTENRVLRGGSWYNLAGNARAACRCDYGPDYRVSISGFRLALARPSAGS